MSDYKQRVGPEQVMQFVYGYAPPLILEAALQHHVFDVLDSGSKTIEQVSQQTGASVRGLRAIMNALVGLELLIKDSEQHYSLTPESATFLVSTKPSFCGGVFRHTSKKLLQSWTQITEIVRIGKPAVSMNQESEGVAFFQEFVEDFFQVTYPTAQVLASALDIAQASQPIHVIDLGAGAGVWGIALAQKSSHVHVTAVDWSGIIPVTRRTAARFGVQDRFRFVEGDLLSIDFGKGYHIAILGHIIHIEGEQRSRALLGKVFETLAPGGTIAIAEILTNEEHTGPLLPVIFAVNTLVNSDHGDTFSFSEISGWLHEIGFEETRIVDAPGLSPLILATKPK